MRGQYLLLALPLLKISEIQSREGSWFPFPVVFFESDNCVLQYVSGVYALYHRGTELKIFCIEHLGGF